MEICMGKYHQIILTIPNTYCTLVLHQTQTMKNTNITHGHPNPNKYKNGKAAFWTKTISKNVQGTLIMFMISKYWILY